MARAREARDWAHTVLNRPLIGESPYTPFRGPDGEALDLDAYRSLITHIVDGLERRLLFLTSGNGEFWSLTLDERKLLLEVGIEVARGIAPDTIIQTCTSSITVQDTVELTQHAQANGADVCYIQTPMMETHGGPGTLAFLKYVADRTDIALGILNSPSSGYVLTPADLALIHDAVPAVCAVKAGGMAPWHTKQTRALAPEFVVWETDPIAYAAGWLRRGLTSRVQLAASSYLFETPDNRQVTHYWNLIWNDELTEAVDFAASSGLEDLQMGLTAYLTTAPDRPGYFTHWGGAFKAAAAMLGLPVGEYSDSRPPQQAITADVRSGIRMVYEDSSLADELVVQSQLV
ncbi:dihydrodipicolinate synthase family protein [Mycobacterium sp. NPDC051804]|uniref:dihydrodipicolinate synthase family protein n=1 Tax=Mycobacterium sp. NPDC051804 TaxID=3364295 RepID=UPI0037B09820